MKKIMELNSQVHIIASKQVGSMAVNDPLLRHLNGNLAAGRNIDWVNFGANCVKNLKMIHSLQSFSRSICLLMKM